MAKSLVVVESPAKAKTINKYLGKGYTVIASMGHVRDLPKSKLGVDVEDDFERESLPAPLENHRAKLYGLTIDPRRLHAIRTQRKAGSRYASPEQCEFEVRRAERLFGRVGLPVRDTTSTSVEEIAAGILSALRRR